MEQIKLLLLEKKKSTDATVPKLITKERENKKAVWFPTSETIVGMDNNLRLAPQQVAFSFRGRSLLEQLEKDRPVEEPG